MDKMALDIEKVADECSLLHELWHLPITRNDKGSYEQKTVHDAYSLEWYPAYSCVSFQAAVHQMVVNLEDGKFNPMDREAPGKVKRATVECCDDRLCPDGPPELGHVAERDDYKILRFWAAMQLSKLLNHEVNSTDLVWSIVNHYNNRKCYIPPHRDPQNNYGTVIINFKSTKTTEMGVSLDSPENSFTNMEWETVPMKECSGLAMIANLTHYWRRGQVKKGEDRWSLVFVY